MAISFPVSIPAGRVVRGIRWIMLDAVGVNESPFTFSQEVYEHAGKRWGIDVQLKAMQRADAEAWVAFLASLRGRRGTFLMGDPINGTARGAATGTPLVKGASQTGGTLLTDGWTAGVTGIVKQGDWIQLGSTSSAHLHKVLADANSDGSGNATLELWPGPRTAPADNATITVTNPVGVWRLTENVRGYDIGLAQMYGLAFSAVEAL